MKLNVMCFVIFVRELYLVAYLTQLWHLYRAYCAGVRLWEVQSDAPRSMPVLSYTLRPTGRKSRSSWTERWRRNEVSRCVSPVRLFCLVKLPRLSHLADSRSGITSGCDPSLMKVICQH